MSIISRLFESRRRKRTVSTLDARWRKVLRAFERELKYVLIAVFGGILHPRRSKIPLDIRSLQSVLFLRYDAIGDAILTTPVFRVLKRYAPHISIGVVASERNRLLFDHDPDVDRVYVLSESSPFRLVRELFRARKIKWDIVINLVFRDKTRGAIFAKLIGPRAITITSVREKQEKYLQLYSWVDQMPPLYPPTPEATKDLDLLLHTVVLPVDAAKEVPSLPDFSAIKGRIERAARRDAPVSRLCPSGELTALRESIQSLIQHSGKSHYIIINTDAAQLFREWGHTNSLDLARMIVERMPDTYVFLTSAPSRGSALRERINSAALNNISYLDTPSVLHLATAVRGAAAVISPDTSVVHFATAQQVPVVGLYLEENEFLPYASASRVVFAPTGKPASAIRIEDVFRALEDLLDETSPGVYSSASRTKRVV